MKKLILSAAILSATLISHNIKAQEPAGSANAGQTQKAPRTPEEEANHNANKLAKELTLTDEQKAKVKALALERINANQPLREKAKATGKGEDKKAIHQQIKANDEKFDTAVEAFLTPEQKAKWAEYKKQMMEKRESHKNKSAPAPSGSSN